MIRINFTFVPMEYGHNINIVGFSVTQMSEIFHLFRTIYFNNVRNYVYYTYAYLLPMKVVLLQIQILGVLHIDTSDFI